MRERRSVLHPIHNSYRVLVARGHRVKPQAMDSLPVSAEQFAVLQGVSNDIFVDCCNAGVPFQEALAAVYLSGLQHGQALSKENTNG